MRAERKRAEAGEYGAIKREITLRFESPIGVVVGREFERGQAVRVTGTVVGGWGIPEPATPVKLDIWPISPTPGAFPPYTEDTNTNLVGNYWFDIVLPDVDAVANVRVTATMWTAHTTVPIAIGEYTAPPPPAPPPEYPPWLVQLRDVLIWGSVGAVVVGGVYLVTRRR